MIAVETRRHGRTAASVPTASYVVAQAVEQTLQDRHVAVGEAGAEVLTPFQDSAEELILPPDEAGRAGR
jgi:hypothetical protein